MSKVYLLTEESKFGQINNKIKILRIGIVSNVHVAVAWRNINIKNFSETFELDSPELLNRISKENKDVTN